MRKVRNTEKESKYQKCMRNTKKYQHYKMNENYKKVSEIQKKISKLNIISESQKYRNV